MEPSAFGDKSLSESTAKQITDYIISEKLRPGDRLPNETELGRAIMNRLIKAAGHKIVKV